MPEIVPEFFVSGGTLPVDSESYIERLADGELQRHLKAGRYCYVLDSRQMGKSSLSVRTVDRLNAFGIQTAFIDLTHIGQNITAEQWYAGLTGEVGRAVGLTSPVMRYFKNRSDLNPMQRFFGAIREVVLEQISEPIVIFIDEIDGTRNLPFDTDEFYAGIRECYNRRVHDKICERLTFCLIGVSVPNDLVRNPMVTPFNIGERIRLQDFSLDEVQRFGSALGPAGNRLARRVHYWTNGQPFLTQSLCREIAADTRIQEERDVDALVQKLYFGPKALETNLNLADVANRVLWDSEQSADPDRYRANLLSAYERTWRGGSIADDEANRVAVVLKLSGLLRCQGARLVTRNRIYHRVFNRTWIEASMPNQELLRQTHSFRRGLARGIGLAALVGCAIGGLALLAFREREDAIDSKSALEYELYVAQMNSLSLLEASGDQAGMAAVLDRSRTNPNRGFEWNFWMGRLHDALEEYSFDYAAPGKDEYGVVSQDGRQICVVDRLARAAAVIDRESKRTLAGADITGCSILASKAGFLSIEEFKGNRPIDSPIVVTNFVTGKPVSRIGTPGYLVSGVAHRDRSEIVVLEERRLTKVEDRIYTAWDATTGQRVYENDRPIPPEYLGDPNVLMSTVSKDGSRYAFRGYQLEAGTAVTNARLVVWDGIANRKVDDIAYPSSIAPTALSESGKLLAYRDEQGIVRLRDLDRRRDIYSLDTGVVTPVSICISPDDRVLICITSDGLATVREIPSGRLLAVRSDLKNLVPSGQDSLWVGCSSSIRLLKISTHEQGIFGPPQSVASDGEGALRVVTRGRPWIDRLSDPDLSPMQSIPLPPGGKSLTYNRLWCLTPWRNGFSQLSAIGGTAPPIPISVSAKNLACGMDSKVFAVLGKDGLWRGMSGSTGALLWQSANIDEFSGMWLTRDSRHLIGTTEPGYIVSLDPITGKELRRSRAHHVYLSSLSFSRDGRKILTGGGDGLAVLWDTGTLEKLQEFRGNTGQAIVGADVSPDGRRVATCNNVGDWQIWDSKTGVKLTKVRVSNFPLRSLTFTSDGKKLVTTGEDGVLRTWSGFDHDPTVKTPVPRTNLKNIIFK